MARAICLIFALVFLLPVYVAVEALRTSLKTRQFQIRGMIISQDYDPLMFLFYRTTFLLVPLVFGLLSIACILVAYEDPWAS